MGLAEQRTKFTISLPGDGSTSQVMVGGVDVTEQVGALRLEAAEGRTPVLTLIGKADGIVEADGIVQTPSGAANEAEVITEFLSRIDPVQLEAKVLARDLPYGEAMTMRGALDQLIEWASGG
jgi:hypothetical protein